MGKIRMIVKDLKNSRIKLFYDMILLEKNGARALNIAIGEHEANNISIFLDKINPPRPLTYDVFKTILEKFSLTLKEVEITKFFEGNFYANAVFTNGEKEENFDMRPSDAINLALRFDCPIYASEEIMNIAGFDYAKFFPTEGNNSNTLEDINNMSIFGINMLQDLLKDALEKEDYITASILRDKIKDLEKEDEQ